MLSLLLPPVSPQALSSPNLPNSQILSLPHDRSICVETTSCGLNGPGFDFRFWLEIFALAGSGPTHIQIYWESRSIQRVGLNLTSHLPLVTRLRMSGVFPAPSACSWCGWGRRTGRKLDRRFSGYESPACCLLGVPNLGRSSPSRSANTVNYSRHQTKEKDFAQCRQTVVSVGQLSKQPRYDPRPSPVFQARAHLPGAP